MNNNITINIPPTIKQIMTELNTAGYQSYIVGGCVRDALRGVAPDDWDVTTDATPNEMKDIFADTERYRLISTGEQYGTMTVVSLPEPDLPCEVTTYRTDGIYSDGRRPDSVIFSKELQDDLSRRDFTVNAMAYNADTGMVDPFGGCDDLRNRVIRCVGVPAERFNEDTLRVMRGIRFAICLDFKIDNETLNAIWECGHNLVNVSQERITAELIKTLRALHRLDKSAPHNQLLCRMVEYIIKRTIQEFIELAQLAHNSVFHYTDVFTHTTDMLFDANTNDVELLLTILFHDIGKLKAQRFDEKKLVTRFSGHEPHSARMAAEILHRMRLDNRTITRVVKLIKFHDYPLCPDRRLCKKRAKTLLNKLGHELCLKLYEFQLIDKKAHRWGYSELFPSYETWVKYVAPLVPLWDEIIGNGEPYRICDLAISGGDLIENGFPQGKAIGEALDRCLEYVLHFPEKNNKADLFTLLNS